MYIFKYLLTRKLLTKSFRDHNAIPSLQTCPQNSPQTDLLFVKYKPWKRGRKVSSKTTSSKCRREWAKTARKSTAVNTEEEAEGHESSQGEKESGQEIENGHILTREKEIGDTGKGIKGNANCILVWISQLLITVCSICKDCNSLRKTGWNLVHVQSMQHLKHVSRVVGMLRPKEVHWLFPL